MFHGPGGELRTLERLDDKLGLVPGPVVTQLGRIDASQGREELFMQQRPAVLHRLTQVARVQSAASSNAIEGIVAPAARIRALVDEGAEPRNRSEAEIAGYRSVLDLVHRSARDMPFTPEVVLQMHRDMYAFAGVPGGRWKGVENHIEEVLPGGHREIVFRTLPAAAVPDGMRDLHAFTREALEAGRHHRLLVTGAYVLDFLCIHPFLDGNGRMSRLLTLLLLYRAGYGVGRYVSLERVVEQSRDAYYGALRASSEGWHTGVHDPWPWMGYLLGTVVAAYGTFEERVGVLGARGAKTEAIEEFVASLPPGHVFRVADVRRIAGGASDSHISKVLSGLRERGLISPRGRGRGASWERSGVAGDAG